MKAMCTPDAVAIMRRIYVAVPALDKDAATVGHLFAAVAGFQPPDRWLPKLIEQLKETQS